MIHELKCKPEYFRTLSTQSRNYDIRKADRDYRVTDSLYIREYAPVMGYTGRHIYRRITHILKESPGLDKNYIILSLSL